MKNLVTVTVLLFVSVHLSQAQVTFEKNGQQIPRVSGWNVAVGDFNEDGALDAVFGSRTSLDVYFGDGKGLFTNSNQKLSISALELGDVNHDEHVDVIGGNTIWINDGKGNFTSTTGITGKVNCSRRYYWYICKTLAKIGTF